MIVSIESNRTTNDRINRFGPRFSKLGTGPPGSISGSTLKLDRTGNRLSLLFTIYANFSLLGGTYSWLHRNKKMGPIC